LIFGLTYKMIFAAKPIASGRYNVRVRPGQGNNFCECYFISENFFNQNRVPF
jgi:hypothetical protein